MSGGIIFMNDEDREAKLAFATVVLLLILTVLVIAFIKLM